MRCFLLLLTLATIARAEEIAGPWSAYVLNNQRERVAFELEIDRKGDRISGALVNGGDRVRSTSGSFDGATLRLGFDYYDAELTAKLVHGELEGAFVRRYRKDTLRRELHATRAPAPLKGGSGPDLTGDWRFEVDESGKRTVWRATFDQAGPIVKGTFIPVSGDWGMLTGRWEGGQVTLSRFDGIRALLFRGHLTADGAIEGELNSQFKAVGRRAQQASAAAPDPNAYTSVKDPSEPFRFSFPDLDGHTVSLDDARFRGKAVVVTIMGSWCPNCHDEAPVLKNLYDRYHAQGLEVIALAFEYTGEVPRDREQVKRFVALQGLPYVTLLAGTTDEGDVAKKLPQLVNFGAYPTTIFLGRDHRVRRIHAGFDGPATGAAFARLKHEMDEFVQTLLR